MKKLPEEFDNKRDLDVFMCENIKDRDVCHSYASKCNVRCNKYVYKTPSPNNDTKAHRVQKHNGPSLVPFYTKNRSTALDLIEEFSNGYSIEAQPNPLNGSKDLNIVSVKKIVRGREYIYKNQHEILSMSICLAVYYAYNELKF